MDAASTERSTRPHRRADPSGEPARAQRHYRVAQSTAGKDVRALT